MTSYPLSSHGQIWLLWKVRSLPAALSTAHRWNRGSFSCTTSNDDEVRDWRRYGRGWHHNRAAYSDVILRRHGKAEYLSYEPAFPYETIVKASEATGCCCRPIDCGILSALVRKWADVNTGYAGASSAATWCRKHWKFRFWPLNRKLYDEATTIKLQWGWEQMEQIINYETYPQIKLTWPNVCRHLEPNRFFLRHTAAWTMQWSMEKSVQVQAHNSISFFREKWVDSTILHLSLRH